MQLALPALAALAACSTSPPAVVPDRGRAPAVDRLVDALLANKLEPLVAIVAEPIAAPLPHAVPLVAVAGAKDRLVAYDASGAVEVWDPRSARPLARFEPKVTARTIALSPDGNTLALCGDQIFALEVASGELTRLSADVPVGCGWFPDGRLAVGGGMGLRIYDGKTLITVDTLPVEGVRQIAVGAAGAAIVTETGGLWRWSGTAGEPPTLDATAHRDPTRALVVGPDGVIDVADAIAMDGRWAVTPRGLVDPTTDAPVLAIPGTVAGWGDQLVALGPDGAATIYAFGGFLIGHSGAIVAIAPKGELLLTAAADGYAIVWKNGAIQARTPRSDAPLIAAGWLGDRIATRDARGRGHIYDAKTGELDGDTDATLAAQTAADVGAWHLTGDAAGALRLHALTLDAANARACGILRRFDRGGEASCR